MAERKTLESILSHQGPVELKLRLFELEALRRGDARLQTSYYVLDLLQASFENNDSQIRAAMLAWIDALQADITRRYPIASASLQSITYESHKSNPICSNRQFSPERLQ